MGFNIRNVLPDIAVALCFFPTGFHLGLVLFTQHFVDRGEYFFIGRRGQYCEYALTTSIFSAIGTAAVLYFMKWRYKGREHFHHFKFLICGIFMFISSGVAFFLNRRTADQELWCMFFGGLGQGMVYIAGLSYINIRVKRRRALKFAPSFLLYFIGISLALELIRDKLTLGLILSVSSSVILICLLAITTTKQLGKEKCARSFDEDINSGFYTHDRNQLIGYLQTKHVLGKDLYIGKVDYTGAEVYMLFMKLPCAVLFHAIFLTQASTNQFMNNMDMALLQWAACAGVAIGIILLFVFSTRTLLVLCLLASPVMLAMATYNVMFAERYYLFSSRYSGFTEYACYVALLGAVYISCEMAILDTAPIKSSPNYLAIGFTIEKVIILFAQFYIYQGFSYRLILLPQVIGAGAMLVLVMLFALFKMPNTFGKSLIEIKINIFWGIRYGYANIQATGDSSTVPSGQVSQLGTPQISQLPSVAQRSQRPSTPQSHVTAMPQVLDMPTRSNVNDGQ